jgi:mannose-6-phosphate isomerase-like protein (cupin superfamily)
MKLTGLSAQRERSGVRFASVLAICLAAGSVALAQSTGADRWWRPELDATVAAPQHHKVLLENDEVRVLEVTVEPGMREPLHVHRYPAVMIIETSPHMVEHLQDGSSRDLGVRPPGARWFPVVQGHAMENVGSIPLHAIRVELKKSQGG